MNEDRIFVAFAGTQLIATGSMEAVLRRTMDSENKGPVLFFDRQTGRQVDFDLRGTQQDVLARLPHHPLFATPAQEPHKGPGRPRLGVVCREVCLLPNHWNWLAEQPGGPSSTLRRLVQEASQREPQKQRAGQLRNAVDRMMMALAGDLPGYEEASRALWARQGTRFEELVRSWPEDLRQFLVQMVRESEQLEIADQL